jgi:hypothetical protein
LSKPWFKRDADHSHYRRRAISPQYEPTQTAGKEDMTHANKELTLDHLNDVSGGGTDPWVHPRPGPTNPWEAHRDLEHKLENILNAVVSEVKRPYPF